MCSEFWLDASQQSERVWASINRGWNRGPTNPSLKRKPHRPRPLLKALTCASRSRSAKIDHKCSRFWNPHVEANPGHDETALCANPPTVPKHITHPIHTPATADLRPRSIVRARHVVDAGTKQSISISNTLTVQAAMPTEPTSVKKRGRDYRSVLSSVAHKRHSQCSTSRHDEREANRDGN